MTDPICPKHVAIVALGPSCHDYLNVVDRHGSRRLFDEVWCVNGFGGIFQCDRTFHMDDVRIQEIRAAADPDGKIAHMLAWLRTAPGPVYTSRAHPDYPGLVEYPLEAVINAGGSDYLNNTAAYAIALAVAMAVPELTLFGMDFTYPNANHAEAGRGCCEYWIGRAEARGMRVHVAETSSLLDACLQGTPGRPRYYGYDTLDVAVAHKPDGKVALSMTPHDRRPTAAEIERRYCHDRDQSPPVGPAAPTQGD